MSYYDTAEMAEAPDDEGYPCDTCGGTDLPLYSDYRCTECHEADYERHLDWLEDQRRDEADAALFTDYREETS